MARVTANGLCGAFKPVDVPADPAGFIRILKERRRFALYFTREGVQRDYGGSNHEGPTLFVLDPDTPFDLIDFWNLRLFHSTVLPVSTRWFHKSRDFLCEFVRENYRPPPRNPHGVMITPTIQFGRSIGKEPAEVLVADAGLTALQGCRGLFKLGYDAIWRDDKDDHYLRSGALRRH